MTNYREAIERAAAAAHDVNRAYCLSLGDDSQVPWLEAPDWQKESAIAGAIELSKQPNRTAREQHELWLAHKTRDGWVHGAVKDAVKKTHPCMVPYRDLPPEQQAKDTIFRAVVVGVLRGEGVLP